MKAVVRVVGGAIALFGAITFFTELTGEKYSVVSAALAIWVVVAVATMVLALWLVPALIVAVFGSEEASEAFDRTMWFWFGLGALAGAAITIWTPIVKSLSDLPPGLVTFFAVQGGLFALIVVWLWLYPD